MDYELAKQLRDAGYPQQQGPLLFPAGHNPRTLKGRRESATLCAYVPALAELVAACVALSDGGVFRLRHRSRRVDRATLTQTCRAPRSGRCRRALVARASRRENVSTHACVEAQAQRRPGSAAFYSLAIGA